MRANGVIGSDYVYYTEKVGSTRKEVGFHGYIAVTVLSITPLDRRCSSAST